MNYQIVLDVWEANVKLDEQVLLTNGVKALIIRMNDTIGGDHLDENFKSQWAASTTFYRMPYVVFAPWLTVAAQYDWIMANIPPDAHAIALDVELDAYIVNPKQVSNDLCVLINSLQNKGLKVHIYSGTWWWQPQHITYQPWMLTQSYWWAAYPYLFRPSGDRRSITWEQLKAEIARWTWNTSNAPGKCLLRQVSDVDILPGTGGKAVDVNIFKGTEAELAAYLGGNQATPPAPPAPPFPPIFTPYKVTVKATATPYVNVRPTPGTSQPAVGHVYPGVIVTILEEAKAPDGLWGRITMPTAGWIRLDFVTKG